MKKLAFLSLLLILNAFNAQAYTPLIDCAADGSHALTSTKSTQTYTCTAISAGGTPGGSNGQVQYNNSGSFGGFTVSGDGTLNTSTGALTITKVNGVAYGTNPSTNTVPVVTGTNAVTYEAVPNAALANSAITFGATSQALGSTVTNLNAVNIGPTTAGTGAFTTLVSTSTSATAFAVGANGTTNPVLSVDASTGTVITGVAIKGAATGGTTTLTATDSGSNTGITMQGKGSGNVNLNTISGSVVLQKNGTALITAGGITNTFTGLNNSFSANNHFSFNASSGDANMTASTDVPITNFNNSVTRQHATGALTLQRDFVITGATDSFVGASTLTDGATLSLGVKSCGTNGTCTNESALYIPSATISGTVTNSYAINAAAATGATNNYGAKITGRTLVDGLISTGTKFTTSGCSVSATTGGATAGTYTSGTTGTCTVTITMNGATGLTATNGWSCWAADLTTPADLITQTASSTTTATLAGTTVSGDVINFGCMGY